MAASELFERTELAHRRDFASQEVDHVFRVSPFGRGVGVVHVSAHERRVEIRREDRRQRRTRNGRTKDFAHAGTQAELLSVESARFPADVGQAHVRIPVRPLEKLAHLALVLLDVRRASQDVVAALGSHVLGRHAEQLVVADGANRQAHAQRFRRTVVFVAAGMNGGKRRRATGLTGFEECHGCLLLAPPLVDGLADQFRGDARAESMDFADATAFGRRNLVGGALRLASGPRHDRGAARALAFAFLVFFLTFRSNLIAVGLAFGSNLIAVGLLVVGRGLVGSLACAFRQRVVELSLLFLGGVLVHSDGSQVGS